MVAALPFDSRALEGRVAVVTGGAGGLGVAICDTLLAMGARVVQADISHPRTPVEVVGLLQVRCDIADPASVAALAGVTHERFGGCDVLVNNAAISASPVSLEMLPLDLWDRVFAVNVRGALLCAQAFVPAMFERRAGSIINIASISARSPTQLGAYGSSKAALHALTQQMAVEWGPRGVRANSVSPGMIRTPLSEKHYHDESVVQARVARIPARRLGRPTDIASAVGFLACDASAYVNGEDLMVDGGFLKASLSNLYNRNEPGTPASGS